MSIRRSRKKLFAENVQTNLLLSIKCQRDNYFLQDTRLT